MQNTLSQLHPQSGSTSHTVFIKNIPSLFPPSPSLPPTGTSEMVSEDAEEVTDLPRKEFLREPRGVLIS